MGEFSSPTPKINILFSALFSDCSGCCFSDSASAGSDSFCSAGYCSDCCPAGCFGNSSKYYLSERFVPVRHGYSLCTSIENIRKIHRFSCIGEFVFMVHDGKIPLQKKNIDL